jgi:hypothetical protein
VLFSEQKSEAETGQRNKFEDTPVKAWASIQKGRRLGGPLLRIFDKLVEHASREK